MAKTAKQIIMIKKNPKKQNNKKTNKTKEM